MSGKRISQQHQATFDGIRHQDADGNEYWRARQLAKVLEYSEYRHFLPVIVRAKAACRNSSQTEANHFEDILEMVEIGSGAQRPVDDVRLAVLLSRNPKTISQNYLRPLLVQGRIVMIPPDTPNSPQQAYRSVEAGEQ